MSHAGGVSAQPWAPGLRGSRCVPQTGSSPVAGEARRILGSATRRNRRRTARKRWDEDGRICYTAQSKLQDNHPSTARVAQFWPRVARFWQVPGQLLPMPARLGPMSVKIRQICQAKFGRMWPNSGECRPDSAKLCRFRAKSDLGRNGLDRCRDTSWPNFAEVARTWPSLVKLGRLWLKSGQTRSKSGQSWPKLIIVDRAWPNHSNRGSKVRCAKAVLLCAGDARASPQLQPRRPWIAAGHGYAMTRWVRNKAPNRAEPLSHIAHRVCARLKMCALYPARTAAIMVAGPCPAQASL